MNRTRSVELRCKMPYVRKSLEVSADRRERWFIKLSLGVLVGLVAFIALCWGGRRAYVHWQEKRMVIRAAVAFEKGDDRAASLATQTVLAIKPTSIIASRMAAQLAERVGDKASALQWRRKVIQLQKVKSDDDVLAWAGTALRFNDIGEAKRALDQLSPAGKESARYHAVLAALAQQAQHDTEAESEWKEAVRLAPDDGSYLLQLAVLELKSRDEAVRASARTKLEQLRNNEQQRLPATRLLIQDALARHESSRKLLAMAQDLAAYPKSTLSDRLIYLDFLHQLNDPEFSSYLTKLQDAARNRPEDLAALLGYLSQNNLNLLALDYLKTIPAAEQQPWPVPATIADIRIRLRDWTRLEDWLRNENWRQFDIFRHAYLARALRELDKQAASLHEWSEATKDAADNEKGAYVLFQMAHDWHWEREMVDLLWILNKYPDRQRDALSTLYRYYSKENDTEGLYRVALRLAELDPENLDFKNNVAQIGLLLEAQTQNARKVAAEVYGKNSANPAYATTYAYSLLTQGKKDQALEVMKKLPPSQLHDPSIAAYYGICLAAVKDPSASIYLKEAEKAPLLPQEKELVEKAKNSLR